MFLLRRTCVCLAGFSPAHWTPSSIDMVEQHEERLTPELQPERSQLARRYRPLSLRAREFLSSQTDHLQYHYVTTQFVGERLDEFVLQHYPEWRPEVVKKLVESGYIYRYQRTGRKVFSRVTDRVLANEVVVVPTSAFWQNQIAPPTGVFMEDPRAERRRELHLSTKAKELARSMVLFKNEHVIVIDKPYGIPMNSSSSNKVEVNIADLLPALKFTNSRTPLIVNRLDTQTSGCVLLARSENALRLLSRMFMRRVDPNSVYWGYCVGKPAATFGRLCMHIEEKGRDRFVVRPNPTPQSRVALAEFVVNASALEYGSFISFYPLSNRRHQTRIMCAHALRCPILGDREFGGEAAFPRSLSVFWGTENQQEIPLHLHHRKIQLPYKRMNGQFITVTAPVPKHMAHTMEKMGWPSDVDDPLVPS